MSSKNVLKIESLKKRIVELELAIQDIERRKKTELDREHPSQQYIEGLKFELRGFRADLERLRGRPKDDAREENPQSNVIRLSFDSEV